MSAVYKISCSECPKFYIGQTKRLVTRRFEEHKKEYEKAKKDEVRNINSMVARHMIDEDHKISIENVEILKQARKNHQLDATESLYIAKEKRELLSNHDEGNCASRLIKIEEDDMLPKQVCANCYELLNQYLAFKEQIASADTALRRCVDQLKQVEITAKEDVFEASDLGITQPHFFDATSTLKQLNEGYKIEELIEEESYSASDEIISSKDVQLCSEDIKLARSDGDAIVYLPEGKSEVVTRPNNLIASASKEQCKSQTSVKYEHCDKSCSCNSHIQRHINKLYASENQKNQCCDSSKNIYRDHIFSQIPNETTEEQPIVFNCAKCNESFAVESDLHIHESIHAGRDTIQSRQCGKEFLKVINLQRHGKTHCIRKQRCLKGHKDRHTDVRKFIPPTSLKSFADRSKLTKYLSINAGKKAFVCKVCNKSFKLKSNLLVHLRVHTGEKPYKCSECLKSFRLKISLTRHFRTHTGETPYKCPHCLKYFVSSSTLADHVRRHTGEKPFKCDQCSKSFARSRALVIHVRTHTGEKPYKCSHCPKSFDNATALTIHVRIHTGERPYKCLQCSKLFVAASALNVHIRSHTGEKPYKCLQCSKSYRNSSALASHIRKHTGEKPHKCPHCSKSFSSSSGLVDHVRRHTGEKPHKCSHCSKTFAISSALTVHIRTHTGEKPYRCPHCSKSFRNTSALTGHIRTHTGEKPYLCPHCSKSFSSSSGLADHVRRHTGEKPYKCSQCPKSFSCSSTLTVHVRTHTGERPHKCPHCSKAFNRPSTLADHVRSHTGEEP